MCYLNGMYVDNKQEDIKVLQDYILSCSGPLAYTGIEEVIEGKLTNDSITLLHNRSVSENVIYNADDEPFNGSITIQDGNCLLYTSPSPRDP